MTALAAMQYGRNSIGYEIDPEYFRHAVKRAKTAAGGLFSTATIETHGKP